MIWFDEFEVFDGKIKYVIIDKGCIFEVDIVVNFWILCFFFFNLVEEIDVLIVLVVMYRLKILCFFDGGV